MPTPPPAILDARRREFGAFLRSRRARLTPSTAGLPIGSRRRTPGLRREEVALLAGVGATWYTWLEQGRDVRASAEVLASLADALQLDATERRHLFILADRPYPEPPPSGPEQAPEALIRMLQAMDAQPAYLLGRRWDLLAWNKAAADLFGDFGRLQGDARNLMHLMFTDAAHRARIVDWDTLAPLSLAMFRTDSARYPGDPDFARLIALLLEGSPEFRAWWPKQDVVRHPSTVKRIRNAAGAVLPFEYMSLDITDRPGMRLIVCTPRPLP